ncbi:MAG TPA: alcohol dehydrogenase catalytic domain-containing protein [Syntrophomonadaceae bacterium]|nr:alcohol dehydrogenase catalytic domain-containing protein [Syntrophomonadaceae bacterium]
MRVVSLAGERQLSVIETEEPKSEGEKVIISVAKVGICGSDIHLWEKGERVGLVMGHEFSGKVVDPGGCKDKFRVGDRVTVIPLNNCGECVNCKNGKINMCLNGLAACPGITAPGAYAEYYAARPDMVRKLPDNVSDEEGAMIEPTAVALHAVRLAGVKPGDKVLITGGGIIGLLCAMWARAAGASYIALTETNPLRRDNALKMGDVSEVFDATDKDLVNKLREASKGGFDQALECAAVAPAVNTAIQALRHGGKMVLVGVNYSLVPIYTLLAVLHELEIKGVIGYLPYEFDLCIELMGKKAINVERFVSRTVGFDGVQEAFERLVSQNNPDVKVLVQP